MQSKSANILLVKMTIVIVVFCLAECAAVGKHPKSSCLKYGHSCWGGHGKRNGGGTGGGGGRIIRLRGEDGPERVANTRWYLSRLIQAPNEMRLWRDEKDQHRVVTRNSQGRHIQNESEVDVDGSKSFRPEDTEELVASESLPEDADSEEVVFMEENPQSLGQKLRLYKIMNENIEKLN